MPRRLRSLLALSALIVPVQAAHAQPQRIVTSGDGTWTSDTRGAGGSARITGANPRNGNGSLELATGGSLTDWGWFTYFAGDPFTAGWGSLASLSRLSFDWYRQSSPPTGDAVWEAQSVAFRIFVRSGSTASTLFSELVWESYYDGAGPTPRDRWITQELSGQLFWRYVVGDGYTIADCSNPPTITPGIPLRTATPAAWGNGSNCYASGDATVYGIGIGVGSSWPYAFRGFADAVRLGFGTDPLVVNDNFELADPNVVPEPGTLVLLASGLVGIGGRLLRRRRG